MKTNDAIRIIALGAICLYSAKVFIQSSLDASSDSFEAFNAILGWSMYLIGWAMFIGGIVATGINLVCQSTKDLEE